MPKDNLENADILRDDETEPAFNDQEVVSSTNSSKLDPLELRILATTSKINKLSFVPFLKTDLKERFSFPVPFT